MPSRNARKNLRRKPTGIRMMSSKVDSLLKVPCMKVWSASSGAVSERMGVSERQLFDGTLVQSIAEQGTEVMHCATMLFLGMVDDATTFAEITRCGGGKSDLPWDATRTRTTVRGHSAV